MSIKRVELDPYVVAKILYMHSRDYVENAGFLSCIRVNNETLRVVDAIPGAGTVRSPVYVELEPLAMLRAYKKLEESGRNEYEFLGGWYHTHPNIGAHFLSMTDIETHMRISGIYKDAFALVVDPPDILSRKSFNNRNLAAYVVRDSKPEQIEVSIISPPLVWDILGIFEETESSSKEKKDEKERRTIPVSPPQVVGVSRSVLAEIFLEWSLILAFTIVALLVTVL